MTKKRYPAVAGLLMLLVAAGFGITMMLPPAPGVTKANFDRVQHGMLKSDIEIILGREADEIFCLGGSLSTAEECLYYWKGHNGTITMSFDGFDGTGKVASKHWYESSGTLLQRIRRWLHR